MGSGKFSVVAASDAVFVTLKMHDDFQDDEWPKGQYFVTPKNVDHKALLLHVSSLVLEAACLEI